MLPKAAASLKTANSRRLCFVSSDWPDVARQQEQDESGAEVFNVLLPSGTPLPARRVHTLQGPGALASLCVELYQRVALQPQTLARVGTSETSM